MTGHRSIGCWIALAVLAPWSGVALAQEASVDTARPILGASLVEENCARCHAVGREGESAHKDAPPFREVIKRYAPKTLAEALGEGITTGHPDMPVFTFEPDEIAAIIAYLDSLAGE